jgi:hypothetical protein
MIWDTTYKNNKKKRKERAAVLKTRNLPTEPAKKDTTTQWSPTNKTTPWWQSIHPRQQRRQSICQQHDGQVSAK